MSKNESSTNHAPTASGGFAYADFVLTLILGCLAWMAYNQTARSVPVRLVAIERGEIRQPEGESKKQPWEAIKIDSASALSVKPSRGAVFRIDSAQSNGVPVYMASVPQGGLPVFVQSVPEQGVPVKLVAMERGGQQAGYIRTAPYPWEALPIRLIAIERGTVGGGILPRSASWQPIYVKVAP